MRALLTAFLLSSTGCVIVYDGPGDWEPVEDEPRDEVDGESEPLPFATYAFDLEADAAAGWSFDRTQRHVGGVVTTADGIERVTLSVTTPTGGALDLLERSPAWAGELVDAQRVWLDAHPLDFVAYRGEDADWLELRGITTVAWLDEGGTTAVDAWVGPEAITLVACGDSGLRTWTVDYGGTVLASDATDAPGDSCAVLAPAGEPMLLHGSSTGGPLTRYLLDEGQITTPMVLHADTAADRVSTASEGAMALFAVFDGRDVDLISAWGETRTVARTDLAEPLVVDVLASGFTAVAYADGAGTVHAHWGSIDDGLDEVAFTVGGPPVGLAVGLRDEVVSIVALDGAQLTLGRQQP